MKISSVRFIRHVASSFAVLAVLASCSAVGDSIVDLAPEINASLDRANVALAVGDTIQVTFPFKNEWTHEARVRPDGSASFLLIDDVKVVGLSLADLDARLTALYAKKREGVEHIELTVGVVGAGGGSTTSANPGFSIYVIGDVTNPGPIVLAGRALTLLEAIGAAGGPLKPTANLRNIILVRRLGQSGEMRSWRLDADVDRWGSLPPIFLQPRDIVFVPSTAIDDVDIWVDQYVRRMIPFPYLLRY